MDPKTCVMGCHYLNTIEAAMAYCIWSTKPDNTYLRDLLKLFKHHQSCYDKMKVSRNKPFFCALSASLFLLQKMEPKKGGRKGTNETIASTAAAGGSTKGVPFKPENIWDIATVERLLKIVLE